MGTPRECSCHSQQELALWAWYVCMWQILLRKSTYRRRGTAGAFFEAIHCHPLDCAGDLRSALLTLATLTQRTKARTVLAGRPTGQACGGSAQSLPTSTPPVRPCPSPIAPLQP